MLDSELVTTLTFESSSTGEAPSVADIPVPTSAYLAGYWSAFRRYGGAVNLYE